MKKNIQIGVIIVMLLLFLSCKKESLLDNALFFAGDNRVELEKVISYYSQKEKDSLKLKAAYFLIENMQYHYYYDGNYIDSMLTYYLTLSKQENIVPQKILDSLLYRSNSFSMQNIEKIYDIHMLDSAFICSNIDFSFKIWEELPWCKNVSFEDFCRYILPYRIGTERPSLWKEYFYSKYYPILHRDIQHLNEPIDAISLLMDSLTKKDFRFTMTAPPNMPNVGPVYAELLCGSCRELTDFSVYVGRSLGIPCAVDFSPMRGDVNDGHLWTVYFSGEDTYVQDFPYGINILQKDKKIKENKLKVYRKQFCVNKLLEQRNVTTEYIYPFFSPPLFDDVTIDYTDNNFINVFHVPDTLFYDNIKRNGSLAYLCLSKRMEWIPVDYGEWKHKILSFYNFQAGVIMRIAGWDGFKLIFYTPPFMIDKECNIKVFKPDSNKQDIVLYSKTNLCTEEDFLRRMIGGVFEGSNDCSFYSRDTLFCIKKESPRLFTEVKVFNDKMYRYVRYMGPADSYCNVSEIKFIGEYDQELRGNIIGTEGDWDDKGTHTYLNVYDDKTETSFDYKYPSGGWSGMDLGEPRKIKKIIYSPRNRDNYVRKNDVYELFYFDREWKSLGIIRSTSDSLLYKDVPKNALFYLKNHTRGVDERVFIYENNKSIFL